MTVPRIRSVDPNEILSNGCAGEGSSCSGGDESWVLKNYIPVSVPGGKPWRKINRDNAVKECRQLNDIFPGEKDRGMEYDLISNREWQTIARDIEQQPENWSGEAVGSGCLKQGNNGVDTKCSYNGGDPERGGKAKASHVLSNEQLIYHFSGNVWEWVRDNNGSSTR